MGNIGGKEPDPPTAAQQKAYDTHQRSCGCEACKYVALYRHYEERERERTRARTPDIDCPDIDFCF